MRWTQIRYGSAYRVESSYSRGKAVVNGVEKKVRGHYYFPVIFPDAGEGSKKEDVIVASEFKALWDDEAQQDYEEGCRRRAEIRAIDIGLETAGYKPATVRMPHQEVWISFDGEVAKAVIEVLLANPRTEQLTRELTA